MKAPKLYRGDIPFFYDKTKIDYQKDPYEKYDGMVVKQSALHLVDEVWEGYPWQPVLDFAEAHYPTEISQNIVELGCGVGRWIGSLAQRYPETNCWGIDYSYQMLKRAREFWVEGKRILFDLKSRGYPHVLQIQGHQLSNLKLGLAKAAQLPFIENSQALVLNSFLLDRVEQPAKALVEMHRILKPDGKLILISPLNFGKARHWESFYPPIKIYHLLQQIGFTIVEWKEDMMIQEPLDLHGNAVTWKCLGLVAVKKVGVS